MTDTSKPLSPEQIAEWKRLADAATKGSLMGLAITALIAEVERLTAENAALAAWQCLFTDGRSGVVSSEHGNQSCAVLARDLVARVTEDEGGNPGYPGHGGLLSRTTIKAADRLSVALQKFEGKENG